MNDDDAATAVAAVTIVVVQRHFFRTFAYRARVCDVHTNPERTVVRTTNVRDLYDYKRLQKRARE